MVAGAALMPAAWQMPSVPPAASVKLPGPVILLQLPFRTPPLLTAQPSIYDAARARILHLRALGVPPATIVDVHLRYGK